MEPRTLCETRRTTGDRSKAVWGMRGTASVLRTTIALALLTLLAAPIQAASGTGRTATSDKLDHILAERASKGIGRSRVIVVFKAGADGSEDVRRAGGSIWRKFSSINGQAVEIANGQLRRLAESSAVESLHVDRPLNAHLNRAAVTIGARAVQEMGYDGAGVGVAVIDSGVTSWHDDLTYNGVDPSVQVVGGQRVAKFVDFVNGRTAPYDDNGHGTHVSGIIAGNGYDTRGARAGIAPAAHIVSLKVLNSAGSGYISNVIAALDWSITNQSAYNIRVINLSVGAPITESYTTDPLTLAAKRVVDSGIVVVAAAGNLGRNSLGNPQYGGITSPGNAPWVLTVGASNTKGTITRTDDEIAPYSSRGPSAIDYSAKPDVIAPGTGIASLSDPTSSLYVSKAANLLAGTLSTSYKPYLALSGTSMAAPMVAGTAALMIQANPKLTPNLVKAILEYTAQKYAYDTLTQGAGFLNTRGAVDLARFFVTQGGPEVSLGEALGPYDHLGQPAADRRRHQAGRQRVGHRHHVGLGIHRRRREHRVGHAGHRLRQHRLGHVDARCREHRVGHDDGRLQQHRLGHVAQRPEHRVGHARARYERGLGRTVCWRQLREHRLGQQPAAAR